LPVVNSASGKSRPIVKSFPEVIHRMRTNPEVAKRALNKCMRITDLKELEDSCQLLKSLIRIKPYTTSEGFKTVFTELAEKVPAARTANPKDFVDTNILEEFDHSAFIDGLYKRETGPDSSVAVRQPRLKSFVLDLVIRLELQANIHERHH
jgi:hypothetical protein